MLRLKTQHDRDAVLPRVGPSRSSSLRNALTENGQVGSRNISRIRGPLPHTSGCRSYRDPQPALSQLRRSDVHRALSHRL